MNLSQRLLQTLALSYFFTRVPFEVLILIVKKFKKNGENGGHHRGHHMVQQSTHTLHSAPAFICSPFWGAVYFASFGGSK